VCALCFKEKKKRNKKEVKKVNFLGLHITYVVAAAAAAAESKKTYFSRTYKCCESENQVYV
jgi:hypothetical protein